MPCATPPWIWPSTIIGLITRPQSCTTTYRLISTCAVSGSTSTTIACTPFAVLPRSGPKYAVASRPGSLPGRTAPRSGFALSASAPSATPRPESPRRCTRPPSSTRSAGAAPSSRLASSSTRSEEHTSELQSRLHLVWRLLLVEKIALDQDAVLVRACDEVEHGFFPHSAAIALM